MRLCDAMAVSILPKPDRPRATFASGSQQPENRSARRSPPWPRTPLRPKRAKRRRWAPLRPRPRRQLYRLQELGIFDRRNEEFSSGFDTVRKSRYSDNQIMKKTSITVTEASRNFADCVNRAHYQNVTFVLLKNGEPVARIVPGSEKVCVGHDLAEALANIDLPENEARAWHRDLEASRKSLKAPADKWR
jgi:antitoxin (DNA-binding transcriptional repressor) of toxin-antitoxin stability system